MDLSFFGGRPLLLLGVSSIFCVTAEADTDFFRYFLGDATWKLSSDASGIAWNLGASDNRRFRLDFGSKESAVSGSFSNSDSEEVSTEGFDFFADDLDWGVFTRFWKSEFYISVYLM